MPRHRQENHLILLLNLSVGLSTSSCRNHLAKEILGGPGTTYEITYHFTKLTGAIVGGVVLVGVIICCLLGKRKRNRDERKRLAARVPRPPGPGGFYPQPPNSFNALPVPALTRYIQEHELVAIPTPDLPRPREYPVPAYQIYTPQVQGAGYEHILRDEGHETNDEEALLPDSNPPPYVESSEEFAGTQRHEREMV
jgi:hypothetical protein